MPSLERPGPAKDFSVSSLGGPGSAKGYIPTVGQGLGLPRLISVQGKAGPDYVKHFCHKLLSPFVCVNKPPYSAEAHHHGRGRGGSSYQTNPNPIAFPAFSLNVALVMNILHAGNWSGLY